MPHLHGLEDRLCIVGLRTHGDVYPVRKEDERVSDLPSVRRSRRPRFSDLSILRGKGSPPYDSFLSDFGIYVL